MSHPIRTTRQAAHARASVASSWTRERRRTFGIARREFDRRMAQSAAWLQEMNDTLDAIEQATFDLETWIPIEHTDRRHRTR